MIKAIFSSLSGQLWSNHFHLALVSILGDNYRFWIQQQKHGEVADTNWKHKFLQRLCFLSMQTHSDNPDSDEGEGRLFLWGGGWYIKVLSHWSACNLLEKIFFYILGV